MHKLFLFGLLSATVGAWTLAAAVPFAPLKGTEPGNQGAQLVDPDWKLLSSYETCSDAAAERLLSFSEATHCSEIYLHLKLSFLPDVEYEDFKSLPPEERWRIQQRGYAAFVAWKEHIAPH